MMKMSLGSLCCIYMIEIVSVNQFSFIYNLSLNYIAVTVYNPTSTFLLHYLNRHSLQSCRHN